MSMLLLMEDSFLPYDLFRASEQGIWLDPSDFSTLFQDAAGTTPVTAVGQPVGLALDKRLGLALGAELVSNGGFDTDTVWVKGTGWSIGSGVATFNPAGQSANSDIYAALSSAKDSAVTHDITANGTYTIRLPITSGGGCAFVTLTVSDRTAGTIRILTASGRVYIRALNGTGFNGSVDNVSVKELAGNHAYQTTSASRPTVEARVNLLTRTEEFDHANWIRSGASVVGNATTAPDGTLTADKIVEDVATSGHFVTQAGIGRRCRIRAKAAERNWLLVYSGVASSHVYVNLTTGAYTTSPDVTSVSTTSLGNDWWLVDIVWNTLSTTPRFYGTTGSGVSSWTGDGVSGIYVWGAELIYDATDNYPYQKVNSATDYADVGAPRYLSFDGTDDGMATPSINFTGTDKMTVWAGVRKLSDAATGMLCELSTSVTNSGTFNISAPYGAAASYGFESTGTTSGFSTTKATTFAQPISNVLSCSYNIASSVAATQRVVRVNGAAPTRTDTSTPTTGSFGNYPLFIGRRGGTTAPFNGRLYGLIVRGAQSTATQIAQTERYLNGQMGGIY